MSKTKFQFHTGSIKSKLETEDLTDLIVFQFHTGSIKSTGAATFDMVEASFNSILVRLKVQAMILHAPVFKSFIPYWFD